MEVMASECDDMESLGVVEGRVELLLNVADVTADAVVLPMAMNETDPGLCSHLLFEYPDLLVITVSQNFESATVYRRVITRHTLKDGSSTTVLDSIRGYLNEPWKDV